MLVKAGKGRILGFDIENMPLTYYAPDYPTARITAIASMWEGEPKSMHVCVLDPIGGTGCTPEEFADHFLERYEEATMVTGHYIRKHDLPHINAMLFELGYVGGLPAKLTHDTKDDLLKWKGLPKNQEYLIAQLDIKTPKEHMTQKNWRDANTFTPEGIAATIKRVKTDVIGQLQLRRELINLQYLDTPKVWRP